jgi:hypothetical protein
VFLVSAPYELADSSPLLGDSRFVCIQQTMDYHLDWLGGAVAGEDYWCLRMRSSLLGERVWWIVRVPIPSELELAVLI